MGTWQTITHGLASAFKAGSKASHRPASPTVPANQLMTIFGGVMKRPYLLDTATGLFDRKGPANAWYLDRTDTIRQGGIAPLQRSPLNERRMFESMLESARFERLRRGILPLDRVNQDVWPPIHSQGLLIEEVSNHDNTNSYIWATGLLGSLSKADWSTAYAAGIGRHASGWNEPFTANVKSYWRGWGDRQTFDQPGRGVMPLFYCQLREERVRGGYRQTDSQGRQQRSGQWHQNDGINFDIPPEWR